MIPSALRDEVLQVLHHSHMGINKSKESQDKFLLAKPQEKQLAESLLNDPVSTKPWTVLALDNFKLNIRWYLIIVDHFSKFTVVKSCKDIKL